MSIVPTGCQVSVVTNPDGTHDVVLISAGDDPHVSETLLRHIDPYVLHGEIESRVITLANVAFSARFSGRLGRIQSEAATLVDCILSRTKAREQAW